jgi:predicted secreted protein
MSWGAIIAIYFLFWVSAAFLMLPFGVRTDEEVGKPRVPGQADSAPHRFDLPRHLMRAALLGAAMFALYYANWHYKWVTIEDLDFYN